MVEVVGGIWGTKSIITDYKNRASSMQCMALPTTNEFVVSKLKEFLYKEYKSIGEFGKTKLRDSNDWLPWARLCAAVYNDITDYEQYAYNVLGSI